MGRLIAIAFAVAALGGCYTGHPGQTTTSVADAVLLTAGVVANHPQMLKPRDEATMEREANEHRAERSLRTGELAPLSEAPENIVGGVEIVPADMLPADPY